MKKTIYLFSLLFLTTHLWAQTQTGIFGKVVDQDSGEELIAANVILSQNGVFNEGTSTDFDGNYKILVAPGTYDMEVSYIGYPTQKIAGIVVKAGQLSKMDVQLMGAVMLDEVVVLGYKVPLISQDNTTSGGVVTSEQIRNLPVKSISSLAATTAGLSQTDSGDAISVRGSRANATDYYIDGIRVRASGALMEAVDTSNDPLGTRPIDRLVIDHQNVLEYNSNGGTPAAFSDPWEQFEEEREARLFTLPKIKLPTPVYFPDNSREEYIKIVENDFIKPVDEPYSTFSIDVDRAAYSIIRRDINMGRMPSPNAARTEEMVNYFDYDYPQPEGDTPFSIYTELGECPWNEKHQLLHVGLQGKELIFENAQGSNLVFLIDVSGSMSAANKLQLLKPAYKLLIDQLREDDKVSIVVYAGAAGLVLPPTSGKDKKTIKAAINNLRAGGSTAGGAGINLAYKIAKEHFIEGGNNRVILATDGDFNVGTSSQEGLKELIEEKRNDGIFLTVLGFGMGNYKDNRLETLADAGNGNYAYIDDMKEAKKVFVTELSGTLFTIAKDVKIQMVFNPKLVKSYRLIGYENRLLAKKDFDDDTKDAGELGAGHTVTALYEIIPTRRGDNGPRFRTEEGDPHIDLKAYKPPTKDMVTVKLRYKAPDGDDSRLLQYGVNTGSQALDNTTDNFRFAAAVASFSLLLKDSKYKGDANCQSVIKLAKQSKGKDRFNYRKEFIGLVSDYETMTLTSGK